MSIMKDDRRTANIDPDMLKLLFGRVSYTPYFGPKTIILTRFQLREKRTSKRDEDKQPDRHQRRTMDDLRAHLKRMDPPVTLSDTFDKVRPRILKAAEFQSLPDDALHSVFDRHMRRLREKDEDVERGVRRSSERDVSRRDGDRPRSDRPHRGGGRRRSRSPAELDPYEADRRKAIAERERNHRKSTMAENLLGSERGGGSRASPPPPSSRRDRDARDREPRDYDRASRPRRDDDRDFDRRDREEDRERYRRRGADRGSYDELPYGDERPASARRRRQDDEDDYSRKDSRDSKVCFFFLCGPPRCPQDLQ